MINISNITEEAKSLNELIDMRIENYLKSKKYMLSTFAEVVSYDSVTKLATIKLPNDDTSLVLKNLSGDTLVQYDTVIALFKNGSNYSTGHIYGKISL